MSYNPILYKSACSRFPLPDDREESLDLKKHDEAALAAFLRDARTAAAVAKLAALQGILRKWKERPITAALK